MKFPVKQTLRWIGFVSWLSCLCLANTIGHAEEPDPRWGWHGWTPSMALGMGLLIHDVDGFVRGVELGNGTIRPPNTGNDTSITPNARLSLSLESPGLAWFPGRPSVVASAELLPTFSLTRNVAAEGGNGELVPPTTSGPYPESAIGGQGSRTQIETKTLAYGLSGGLSFPVTIADYKFRIEPGLSWVRFAYDVNGAISRASKPTSQNPFFRSILLNSHGKLYLNGIGPTLAVQVDSGKVGPFMTAVYVEGSALRILGDQKMNITDNRTITDQLGTDTYQGRWGIEVDDWLYRFGVGLRIYLESRER